MMVARGCGVGEIGTCGTSEDLMVSKVTVVDTTFASLTFDTE